MAVEWRRTIQPTGEIFKIKSGWDGTNAANTAERAVLNWGVQTPDHVELAGSGDPVDIYGPTTIHAIEPDDGAALDVLVETGFGDGVRSRFKVENNEDSQLVDINVRGAVLNIGNKDTGVDADGTKILMQKVAGSTSNYIECYKAGSSTQVNYRVSSSGSVVIGVGGIGSTALLISNTTEAQHRYKLDEFGVTSWGPGGSTATDTNLYRSAANVLATDDDFSLKTLGKGISIKEGANAKMGTATLVGGTVVVSTTAVTANSRIMLTTQSLGTVATPKNVGVTARTAATSFTITSDDATDTSVVAWVIFEPSA